MRKFRFTEYQIVGVLGLGMTYRQDVENLRSNGLSLGLTPKE